MLLRSLAGLVLLALLLAACSDGGESLTDRLLVVRAGGIAELSLATGDETLLIASPEDSMLIEPAVSPDGGRIAYTRQLNPVILPGEPVELGLDLFVANADGSEPRLVAEHELPNDQIRAPNWLPDGERLIVNTQRLAVTQFETALELLDLSTGERTVIVEDAFRPGVSPDGELVAFVRQDEELIQTLWIANTDGSDQRILVGEESDLVTFSPPRFSPDGRFIVFGAAEGLASVRSGPMVSRAAGAAARPEPAAAFNGLPMDIWIMDVAGGEPRKLADVDLDLPSLAWSGDGARIFVLSGTGIFAVDPEGGSRRVSEVGTFHGQLDWLAADEPATAP